METMATESKQNLSFKYYCKNCDYGTSKKSNLDNHNLSAKHKKATDGHKFKQKLCPKLYTCEICEKEYKDRTGLWKHKKKCIEPPDQTKEIQEESQIKINNEPVTNEVLLTIIKQNEEFKQLLMEQNKQVISLASKPTITNNNNTLNNNFNLTVFLNETCKDAMNLTDFVDSLNLTLKDLENTGKLGYEEGISQIFINGLKQLDVNKRPIHCTDTKRERLYVRDQDAWEKDQEKERVRKAIRKVANKNVNQITDWIKENPDAQDYHSKKNDEYLNMILKSTGGRTKEEEEKRINKVISVIAKHVGIDKNIIDI
jgi:hypothetical protein